MFPPPRHDRGHLLQLARPAHARAELRARDALVAGAPARDLGDSRERVDDGARVAGDRQRGARPVARVVEDHAAEEEGRGEAGRDRRLDHDHVERPTLFTRHLRNDIIVNRKLVLKRGRHLVDFMGLLNVFTRKNIVNRAYKWVTIHGETPRDWS